jgi:CBS domain-containing protein
VTDRDIAVRAVASDLEPTACVETIASEPVQWCFESDDIADVQQKMETARIRRIPILDAQKQLVGRYSNERWRKRIFDIEGRFLPARPDR